VDPARKIVCPRLGQITLFLFFSGKMLDAVFPLNAVEKRSEMVENGLKRSKMDENG
jgi:hypothetical protein